MYDKRGLREEQIYFGQKDYQKPRKKRIRRTAKATGEKHMITLLTVGILVFRLSRFNLCFLLRFWIFEL